MKHAPPQFCEICRKPVSRLLGVVVAIQGESISVRSAALGYCSAHRDDVVEHYMAGLAELGETKLVSEPPAELRSGDVPGFLAVTDAEVAHVLGDHTGAETVRPVTPTTVPDACPHCSGRLSWGTGPHVADAAQRPRAKAWECLDCGAAGILSMF